MHENRLPFAGAPALTWAHVSMCVAAPVDIKAGLLGLAMRRKQTCLYGP